MMDPMTGSNRGYAFVTFTTRNAAQEAVRQVKQKLNERIFNIRKVYCFYFIKYRTLTSFFEVLKICCSEH